MSISRQVLVAMALSAAAAAAAKPLACPQFAPGSWGLGKARLASVRVLSHPAGEVIDDNAPLPIMAPGDERERGGKLLQTWRMNSDAPTYVYQFDCLFAGSERFLRVAAPNVRRCTATSSLADNAIIFQCK